LFAKGSCVAVGLLERPNIEEDLTVTISPELEAQILRYHHVEKWPVGTIARHLRLHYDTVARVLTQAGLPTLRLLAAVGIPTKTSGLKLPSRMVLGQLGSRLPSSSVAQVWLHGKPCKGGPLAPASGG
jgi:hypothetical protein